MGNKKSNIKPKSYEGGKVILVDPNPENRDIVTPEDLSILVRLKTTKRERSSILVDTSTNEASGTITSTNNGSVINFIAGSKTGNDRSLTTHYTELNTDFNKRNDDLETLGITGIKIEFNSSYAPLITINFTDVRGKLFEMGNESPFNVFFNLPYPLFELTIKGYYGKAVTYCLHLTKFNGRLNDKTGNYEMTTQFVGYTFAFLADMLMGYLRAVPYTSLGAAQIEEKNSEKVIVNGVEITNTFFTFDELQDGIFDINKQLLKLKTDDPKIKALALAENTIVRLEELKDEIKELLGKVVQSTKISTSSDNLVTYGNFVVSSRIPNGLNVQKMTNAENTFNRTIGLRIKEINEQLTSKFKLSENIYKIINNETKFSNVKQSDFEEDEHEAYVYRMEQDENKSRQIPKLMVENENVDSEYKKFRGFVKETPQFEGEFIIYDLSKALDDLTQKINNLKADSITTKEDVAIEFSDIMANSLGKTDENGNTVLRFEPTILNFFKILSDHVDIFMTSMRELSKKIEENPDKRRKDLERIFKNDLDIVKGNDENILAWPDYKEKDDKVNGYVDKWIGNKAPTLDEVVFVEEILNGLLKAKQRDNEFLNKLELGFRNWYPVNPFDTSLIADFENPWESVSDKDVDEVIRLMLLRATIFLGFSYKDLTPNEIRAMGRIEAHNTYNAIKNQEIKDGVRYYNGNNSNSVAEISDKIIDDSYKGKVEWKNYSKSINNNAIFHKNQSYSHYIYAPTFTNHTTLNSAISDGDVKNLFVDKNKTPQFIPLYNSNKDNRLYGSGYLGIKTTDDVYWDGADNNTLVTNKERRKMRDEEDAIFFSNYVGGNSALGSREDDGGTWFKILDGFGIDSEYFLESTLSFPDYADKILMEEGISQDPTATLSNSYGFLWTDNNVSENTSIFGGLHKTHEFINAKVDDGLMIGGQTEVPVALTFYANTKANYPIFTAARKLTTNGVKHTKYDIDYKTTPINGVEVITEIFPFEEVLNTNGKISPCNDRQIQQPVTDERVNADRRTDLGANKSAILQSLTDRVNVGVPFLGFRVSLQFDYPLGLEENITQYGEFEHFSIFGSDLYYSQDNDYAKAYMFLHSLPFDGMVYNFTQGTFGDFGNTFVDANRGNGLFSRTIQSYFNQRAGFIETPHSWLLFLGAVIKRQWSSGVGGGEYIKFKDQDGYSLIPYSTNDFLEPTNSEYCLTDSTTNQVFEFHTVDNSLGDNSGDEKWIKVEETIVNLPWNIKRTLVDYFENWVDNDTSSIGWKAIKNELELFKEGTTKLQRISYWKTFKSRLANDPLDLYTDSIINPKAVINYIIISKDEKHRTREGLTTAASWNVNFNGHPGVNFINRVNTTSSVNNAISEVVDMDRGTPFNFFLEIRDESPAANKIFDFVGATKICANASWRAWDMYANAPFNGVRYPFILFNDKLSTYVRGFVQEFIKLHTADDSIDKDLKLKQELFQSINNDDIKLNIYKNLKAIHDKWIAGGVGNCSIDRLIDHFRFIDRSYRDISDEFKVNPSNMMEYMVRDYNQSFYEYTARVLTDNNFDFIPLPSWIDYNSKSEIEDVFNTYSYVDTPTTNGPQFVCMYIGERSNKLDLGNQSQYDNDGFDFKIKDGGIDVSILPDDLSSPKSDDNSKVPVFLVKYSDPNQSIFKGFKLDQSEFTETDESLQIIDEIATKGGPNNASGVGQNLFDIYNTRSYSAEIEMMGNAQIQPLMYFQLSSVPMFHGAYTIIKVSHSIEPNSMSTTFKGVRIRHVKTKMVDDTTIFMNLIGSLTDVQFSSADLDDLTTAEELKAGRPKSGKGKPEWSGCITYRLKDGKGLKVQNQKSLDAALAGKKGSTISPWCVKEVGKFMEKIGTMWHTKSKDKSHGDTIYYNDLSLYGGGDIQVHATHETGQDIDFRQVRKDKLNASTNVYASYSSEKCKKATTSTLASGYDREATIDLIELILDEALKTNGFRDPKKQIVDVIWFNDAEVIDKFKNYKGYGRDMVRFSCGHDNHLHVKFNLPDRITDDEPNGYMVCKENLPNSPLDASSTGVGHLNDLPEILESLGHPKGSIVHEMAMVIAKKEGYGSNNENNRPRRNNNPGNLVGTNFKDVDPNVTIESASDPRFAKFSKKELGTKALAEKKIIEWANGGYPSTITNGNSTTAKAFQDKYNVPQSVRGIAGKGKSMTIEQFMYTYAPPNENKTEKYVKSVVDTLNANGVAVTRTSKITDYIV